MTAAEPVPSSHDELLAEAQEAAAQVAAWQARLAEATEALMQTPCADPWRPYLAWALGLTGAEAGEIVELVDRLSELPRTREVLASGERSLRTVLAIARRATPELEATILESTRHFTGAQLERALREYGRITAPSQRVDDDITEDDDPDPSSASWGWRDGRFRLRADLDAADGAQLEAWLDSERARLRECEGESGFTPARERTCAESLIALGERAASGRANDVGFLPDGPAVNVVVHARESDGALHLERAFIPGAGALPSWWLTMFAEQGTLTTTLMLNGEPVLATVPARLATASQRRQLLARDGGCADPGCGATRRLVAHHIRYYDDGGPTSLRNMVLLCRRHHRVVHRLDLRIVPEPGAPGDRYVWRFEHTDGTHIRPGAPSVRRRRRPARERACGSGDRLTHYALDVTLSQWIDAAPRNRAAAGDRAA